MYKILQSDKDSYITNRVVKGSIRTGSNVGNAGTLDLFKLYDFSQTGTQPNTELSRILIHFDLTELKDAVSTGLIDISDPSFWCKISLFDVYGGQPSPINFNVSIFPLSASFDEGFGKDIAFFSDEQATNWISSSFENAWLSAGCSSAGDASVLCDYITSSTSLASTEKIATFKTGDENLLVDVTQIISATLTGEIPDCGFRISFSEQQELDHSTYFVKRFGSRQVYDRRKRPQLVFGYDDSVFDDTQNLTFDYTGRVGLYNSVAKQPVNFTSGGVDLVGDDCILLRLEAQVSGAYSFYFTGSQASSGKNKITGSYFAEINIPSGGVLTDAQSLSGSIKFTPIWTSLDETKVFVTGSTLTINPTNASSSASTLQKFNVSVINAKSNYASGEIDRLTVNIFDRSTPLIKVTRLPVELPGIVVKNAYYRIVDAVSKEIIIPFDDVKNSTKISSDAIGMFFDLDTSSLAPGRTYYIDVMIKSGGVSRIIESASPNFTIDALPGA